MAVDEPAALQAVDRHFVARRFGVGGQVHHRNAADAAGQQFIHRHAAAALLAHGNDDLVHAMARNQVGDRLPARKHAQPALRRRRRFGIDRRGIHADDVTAMAARRLQVLRQCHGFGTDADDQHARQRGHAAHHDHAAAHEDQTDDQVGDGRRKQLLDVTAVGHGTQAQAGDVTTDDQREDGAPHGRHDRDRRRSIKPDDGVHERHHHREDRGADQDQRQLRHIHGMDRRVPVRERRCGEHQRCKTHEKVNDHSRCSAWREGVTKNPHD